MTRCGACSGIRLSRDRGAIRTGAAQDHPDVGADLGSGY